RGEGWTATRSGGLAAPDRDEKAGTDGSRLEWRGVTALQDASMQPGRKVLVMGATGRLGVAVARALAHRGDRAILTARNGPRLEALSVELSRPELPAVPFVCADLLDDAAPEIIFDGIRRTVGKVDDVVIACGPFPRTPFETLRRDDLRQTLAVHAIAPLLLVHALAEDLASARGAVVALTDAGVTRPYTHHVAYLPPDGAPSPGRRAAPGGARQHGVARNRRRSGGRRGSAAHAPPGHAIAARALRHRRGGRPRGPGAARLHLGHGRNLGRGAIGGRLVATLSRSTHR